MSRMSCSTFEVGGPSFQDVFLCVGRPFQQRCEEMGNVGIWTAQEKQMTLEERSYENTLGIDYYFMYYSSLTTIPC